MGVDIDKTKRGFDVVNNQSYKEDVSLKHLIKEFVNNKGKLDKIITKYTTEISTIETKINSYCTDVSLVVNLCAENFQVDSSEYQKKERLINCKLTTLENTINGNPILTTRENYDQEQREFEDCSRILINKLNKEQNLSLCTRVVSLIASITGVLGIGGTASYTALECIGGVTVSAWMITPLGATILFGTIIILASRFYLNSKDRNEKIQMLKDLLNFYVKNIKKVTQELITHTANIVSDLNVKVQEFKNQTINKRDTNILTSNTEQLKEMLINFKKIKELINEISNYKKHCVDELSSQIKIK